jgi:hypothetical protein
MWGSIGKISAIILIIAAIGIVSAVNYLRKRQDAPPFPGGAMQGVRDEIERYDNWALAESVYHDDSRVARNAEKMLEESLEYCNDAEWLLRNSWRFGFVPCGERFRYVGVFHAEQMYYSGVSFEEYVTIMRKETPLI